jgi:hypothetical protein
MRRRGRTFGAMAALLVAVCCVAAAAFAAPAGAQATAFPQADDQPEPDNTITRIGIASNGAATWEITLRTRLKNDSDVAEYERFQERFRSNRSRYLDPFAERMTGVVRAANGSSERKMRGTEFAAETNIQEVPRRWGVVTFRFTWTGFAETEGDAILVGDVFDGGFFIGDDDALAIAVPDGYAIADVSPTPDEADGGVVEWGGREDFGDGRPSLRAVPATTGDGGGSADEGNGVLGGGTLPLVALGVALLAALAALGVRSGRFGRDGDAHASGDSETADVGAKVSDDGESGTADAKQPAGESAGTRSERSVGPAESTESDPALLTDEDRVERTLRDAGGRMKQSDVVDALGWSKSKTSRVLSRMSDDGDVEKLRIGRENVIDLGDDDGSVDDE